MTVLVGLIALIIGIFQIVLFFKVWEMTNDIRAIKEKYLYSDHKEPIATKRNANEFKVDDLVIEIETGKQMRIKFITVAGKYSCYTDGGTVNAGEFDASQIKLYDV